MSTIADIEAELSAISTLLQAQGGQREAHQLFMDALLTAIAQTNPDLLAKADQNFRQMLEGKRDQLRQRQDTPHTVRTFESNVEDILRMLVLLR